MPTEKEALMKAVSKMAAIIQAAKKLKGVGEEEEEATEEAERE